MPIEEFPLLQDNTRLIRHKDTLYKIKIKYEERTNPSASVAFTTEKAHSQIENTFRALLYILQRDESLNLKPVQTENFLITIIQTPWSFCKKYGFSQNGKELKAYPVQFEFRITIKQDDKLVNSAVNVINSTPTKSKASEEKAEIKSRSPEEKTDISEIVAEVDSIPVPRFTRSSRGSLIRDGKRIVSKGSGKVQGSIDSNVSDDATVHRTDTKDNRLKRKPRASEVDRLSEFSGISKRSRTSDKGLKVEQYHNRNNSSKGDTPGHTDERLRIKKSRESVVEKRNSQRLRTKEDKRPKESYTEISESKSESKEINQTLRRHVKRGAKHDSETEISESEKNEMNRAETQNKLRSRASKTRKRRRRKSDKKSNLETSSETEIEEENKGLKDKPSPTRKSKSKHMKSSLEFAQESQTKKHKLYTESKSPVLLANRQSHDKGMGMYYIVIQSLRTYGSVV